MKLNFQLHFKIKKNAEQCALYLLYQEQKVSLFQDDSVEPNEWVITIFVNMEPEYSDIVDLEQWFASIAEKFQGEYDGWGCMAYVFEEESEEDDLLQ